MRTFGMAMGALLVLGGCNNYHPMPEANFNPVLEDSGADSETNADSEQTQDATHDAVHDAAPDSPTDATESNQDALDAQPDLATPEASPEASTVYHSGPCADTNMFRLPTGFCIDRRPVLNYEWNTWAETNPSTDGLPNYCSLPADPFSRDMYCMQPAPNYAVCATWCQAWLYCHSQKKRLCSWVEHHMIGQPSDVHDPGDTEWGTACANHPTELWIGWDAMLFGEWDSTCYGDMCAVRNDCTTISADTPRTYSASNIAFRCCTD